MASLARTSPERRGAAGAAMSAARSAEQRFEEIAEALATGALVEAETAIAGSVPVLLAEVRRRTEILARPIAARAQLVVGRALFLVAQHFVGFVDRLEALLGPLLLADVGVVLAGEPAIGRLEFRLAGAGLDAQSLVIILELHRQLHGRAGEASFAR